MTKAFSAVVLRKHTVAYFHCGGCGLLRTEPPYWLDEAYGEAIARADTGILQRNIETSEKLAALVRFHMDPDAAYLDLAGGYGILVRLMRDKGFDFYWEDKFCQNLVARGFEADKCDRKFAAITAFEVLEHVFDPVAFLADAMARYGTRTIVFSTQVYGAEVPAQDWWYYTFETGQHISLFQTLTLQRLATRLNMNLSPLGDMFVLSEAPTHMSRLKLKTGRALYPLYFRAFDRSKSRTFRDHQALMRMKNREEP